MKVLLAIMAALLLTACASNPDKEPLSLTEQQYYEAAQKAMDANNFVMAVEQLEQLESRFPFGRYAEQTQLDLIYAYYRSLDYESSALQAERFIQQYPNHPEAGYAYYMKGLAHFSTDRGLLARFLPTSPAQRDLTPIKVAYNDFRQFINKYPGSQYAPDARQRMIYLRNLLAEHELFVAQYYMERRAYIAAVNRGKFVVENYPQAPVTPQALAIMVKAYKELKLEDLASSAETVLLRNYPNYPELNAAGKLEYQLRSHEDERSWLNIITFGLLG